MSRRSFGNDGKEANAPKFDKSLTRLPQRGSYSKMRSHERLAGGADVRSKSSANVNANKSPVDTSPKVTPVISGTINVAAVVSGISKVAAEAEEEIAAILTESSNRVTESTGDKKVDDMIDYVIQNLQEAGKALTSLGENFEHDLKLVFVDVMAKVQNWVGLAQLRLDAAKTDLKGLRRELITRANEIATRDNEISELKVKLAESEVAKNVYEKALTENVQRSGGPIPSPSTMTFVPSRQPLPGDAASAHSANIAADSQHISGTNATTVHISGTTASLHPVDAGGISAHSGVSSHAEGAGVAGAASLRSAASAGASLHPIGADAPLTSQGQAAGDLGLTPSAATLRQQQQAGSLQAAQDQLSRTRQPGAPLRPSEISAAQLASHPAGSQPPGSQPPGAAIRSLDRERETPVTADVAVQSGKGKEKGKRELELESELARLRKENEKIVKERADYENAIQRALLRGVSSLNVETLRVLRCPPVSCYTPCGPPPSPVNTVEALIPCPPKKTKDNWTPSGCRNTASSPPRRENGRLRSTLPEREHGCCGKRPNTSSSRLSPRHKKSPCTSTPSMIFLLPRNDHPSVCVNTNTQQNRPSNNRAKVRKFDPPVCSK